MGFSLTVSNYPTISVQIGGIPAASEDTNKSSFLLMRLKIEFLTVKNLIFEKRK